MSTSNRHRNRTHRLARMSRSRGQAIVEFLVAAIAMVPLFILIPLIGKYLDIKHASIAASRKLAFECTVRYEDCRDLNAHPSFSDEIRMRFFSGNPEDVLSNDRPPADVVAAGDGNPLWVDRRGRPLLERYSDVGIRSDARDLNLPAVAGALSGLFGPDRFGLPLQRGMFDARVQVRVANTNGGTNFRDQLESLALNMQFHTAILTDAWSARGPGSNGDTCNTGSQTVVGRISAGSLCLPGMRALDNTVYLPGRAVVIPLAQLFGESNASSFDFHDFLDARFVERVPTSDPVGFPRLQ